jgi:hypothetical protein
MLTGFNGITCKRYYFSINVEWSKNEPWISGSFTLLRATALCNSVRLQPFDARIAFIRSRRCEVTRLIADLTGEALPATRIS